VRLIRISLAFPRLTDIEVHIPVIVVSTKYDQLVKEQRIRALKTKAKPSEDEIEMTTEHYFNDRIKKFKTPPGMEVSIIKVSISKDYRRLCFFPLEVDLIYQQHM